MYYDTLLSSDTLVALVIPCRFQSCFYADDFAVFISGPSVTIEPCAIDCLKNGF